MTFSPPGILSFFVLILCWSSISDAFTGLYQTPLRKPTLLELHQEKSDTIVEKADDKTAPTAIPALESSQFRHPLDQRLTSLVRNAPFYGLAEETLRRGFPLIEQGVRLDLMASSVKVSPQQLPDLHDLLVEACGILNFPLDFVPELYVQSNPQANAYTLAIQSQVNGKTNSNSKSYSSSVIVITSALVDRCTPRELQAGTFFLGVLLFSSSHSQMHSLAHSLIFRPFSSRSRTRPSQMRTRPLSYAGKPGILPAEPSAHDGPANRLPPARLATSRRVHL